MPQKVKKKEIKKGGPIWGAFAGIISAAVMIAIFSVILNKNSNLTEYVKAVITAISIISAIICGSAASRGMENKKMLAGVIAGAIYLLVIIIASLSISLDNISAFGLCEIALICLVGSALGSRVHLCKSNKKLRFKGNRR